MKSGAGTEEVHTPKLWYYQMEDQNFLSPSQSIGSILDSMPFEYNEDCEEDFNESTSVPSASGSDAIFENSPKNKIKPRFKRPRSKTDETIDKITRRVDQLLEKQLAIKSKDEHDIYGEYVAEKMRSMQPNMAIYCQKVMNEALFYAQMNNLNSSSTVVTSLSVMESPDINSALSEGL